MWIPYSRQVAADVANPDRKEAVGQANVLFCIKGTAWVRQGKITAWKDGTVDLCEYEIVEDRFFELGPEIKPTHFIIIPDIP